MFIKKILLRLFAGILCVFLSYNVFAADSNLQIGEVSEYGNLINNYNIESVKDSVAQDFEKFKPNIDATKSDFVPIEAKIGLMFMKVLSGMDYVLQHSLVRFTIIFLLIMYAFWIGLESYKMIRGESKDDYKKVFFNIFKQGMIIAVWIIILNYGPAKIFTKIVSPILALGSALSDYILDAVAKTYKVDIPNTCATIHQYVQSNNLENMIIDGETAANIMCLPSRISVYFYRAIGTAFDWMTSGGVGGIIIGLVSVYVFIGCIFKYAFMTLGVVANLFFTLLLLPFTALAEALPSTTQKGYFGQIFNGLLKLFNTKKISGVLGVFINAAVFFVSLSIIIAICGALMANIVRIDNNQYVMASTITTLLAGALVWHFAEQAEKLAQDIGGSVDNTVGEKLSKDAKTYWDKATKFSSGLAKKAINKTSD